MNGYDAIDFNVEGWMPSENKTMTTCHQKDCVEHFYTKFLLKKSTRVRHIYSVYMVNGAIETSTLKFRLGRAISALKGDLSNAKYIAIAFDSTGEEGLPAEELTAFFHEYSSRKI